MEPREIKIKPFRGARAFATEYLQKMNPLDPKPKTEAEAVLKLIDSHQAVHKDLQRAEFDRGVVLIELEKIPKWIRRLFGLNATL